MCFFKFVHSTLLSIHYFNYLICIRTGLDVQEFGKFQMKRRVKKQCHSSHSKFENVHQQC